MEEGKKEKKRVALPDSKGGGRPDATPRQAKRAKLNKEEGIDCLSIEGDDEQTRNPLLLIDTLTIILRLCTSRYVNASHVVVDI